MEDRTKIHLSAYEKELVTNTRWIFTKHAIVEKVYLLFGELHNTYREMILSESTLFSPEWHTQGGKISRGENYQKLPYVILDFPAFFSREHVFAIRTFFWWGHFFSISLHLSGKYLQQCVHEREGASFLQQHDFFICVHDQAWEHHFLQDNYRPASEAGTQDIFKKDFLKVARKIDLDQWEDAPHFLTRSFKKIMEFIKISYPAGEKVPLPVYPKAGSGL